ncbi:MAG: hypothetical protein ACI4FV_03615 [Lachnospiraceae bacterium]
MTQEDREMLNRINDYANEVLGDIDPQKTPVSYQLEKLRPIMQQLAMEKQMSVENIFIKYMDLASEAGVEREAQFQDDFGDVAPSFSQIANNLE